MTKPPKYHAPFRVLPVGRCFAQGGNIYRKRSTRIAQLIRPVRYAHRWFYFKQSELVTLKAFGGPYE